MNHDRVGLIVPYTVVVDQTNMNEHEAVTASIA